MFNGPFTRAGTISNKRLLSIYIYKVDLSTLYTPLHIDRHITENRIDNRRKKKTENSAKWYSCRLSRWKATRNHEHWTCVTKWLVIAIIFDNYWIDSHNIWFTGTFESNDFSVLLLLVMLMLEVAFFSLFYESLIIFWLLFCGSHQNDRRSVF